MDYTEITTLALSYADRTDDEVTKNVDNFIKIVESRINRALKVADMSTTVQIPIVEGEEYYDLPVGYGGLRTIKIIQDGGQSITLTPANPEQLNNVINSTLGGMTFSKVYYAQIGKKIRIAPARSTGNLELVYYQKLVNLSSTDPENWLADSDPDCYVFGILTEISAFVKDKEAAALWDGRFKSSVSEIDIEDASDRWSGTSMQVKLG